MLLVIDVGNTNIVLGLYTPKRLVIHFRISTKKDWTSDEYGLLLRNLLSLNNIDPKGIKDAIISSVVPPVLPVIEDMINRYFNISPLIVEPGIKTGISILYDDPRAVGADRIVNAVAGYEEYGGPLIIVDFGTAITFDVISKKGEYLGGVIFPGIIISSEALFKYTAQLPKVEMTRPDTVIGRSTVGSMQSGIIFGYAELVDGIVNRIKREIEGEPYVIATGGLVHLISSESSVIKKVDPFLTLKGLKIIFERNKTSI
ncbi:MAG: type III pantothenate kinase [Nitrospinae bacterium]|nr:type III pantothenate kinase [Nitrospinota bacterium]